ncbi:hypothetical protein C8R44DRAFT_863629 [Mycena epipterygia]|nr:hypothetical protein C8R44DRAFT_863629 [Mycena epipterygia]
MSFKLHCNSPLEPEPRSSNLSGIHERHSPRRTTIQRFLHASTNLRSWNLSQISGSTSGRFHTIRLICDARAELIKATWANFKNFELTIYEVIESGSTFIGHVAFKGESVSGTPWANEYILIVQLTTPTAGLPKIVSL